MDLPTVVGLVIEQVHHEQPARSRNVTPYRARRPTQFSLQPIRIETTSPFADDRVERSALLPQLLPIIVGVRGVPDAFRARQPCRSEPVHPRLIAPTTSGTMCRESRRRMHHDRAGARHHSSLMRRRRWTRSARRCSAQMSSRDRGDHWITARPIAGRDVRSPLSRSSFSDRADRPPSLSRRADARRSVREERAHMLQNHSPG